MLLRFLTIPVCNDEAATEDLNRFLGSRRIVAIDRQFVHDGANSVWALCVSYVQTANRPPAGRRGSIDYRDVLSEADFSVFAKLRALRKTVADAEGVPAYALFTNEQLAEMVQRRVRTAGALREVAGVGEARVEKYGERFLSILREENPTAGEGGEST